MIITTQLGHHFLLYYYPEVVDPVNLTRWPDAGLMLDQCRRRWSDIKSALVQPLMLAVNFVTGVFVV